MKGSDTSVKEEAKQKVTLTKLVKSTSVKATEKTAQPATKVLPSTEATAECMPQVSQVDNCSLSSETKEKKPTKEVNVRFFITPSDIQYIKFNSIICFRFLTQKS